MTIAQYDEAILSDLHKDARGFRPREFFWNRWNEMTVEEKNAEWLMLCNEVDQSIEEDRAREAAALASYEASITNLMEAGASDRATAIEWLVESLYGPDHLWQDAGEVCYHLGLSYSMDKEFQPWFDKVMKPRWKEHTKDWG